MYSYHFRGVGGYEKKYRILYLDSYSSGVYPFSEVEYYSPNYQAVKVSETEFKIATGIPNCNISTQNIYGYEISNLVLCPLGQASALSLKSLDTAVLKVVEDSLFVILKEENLKNSLGVVDSDIEKVDTLSLTKHAKNQNILIESKEEVEKAYIWFNM